MAIVQFRYKRAVTTMIGDRLFSIPVTMTTRQPENYSSEVPFPRFHLEKVHDVEVPDLLPEPVIAQPGMTPAFVARLEEASYEHAIERRRSARRLRDDLRRLSAAGIIEVVADESGFLTDATIDITAAEERVAKAQSLV